MRTAHHPIGKKDCGVPPLDSTLQWEYREIIVSPIPAPHARLFDRAVREALDGAMSPDRAAAIVAMALLRASLDEIPEELAKLEAFVQGPLRGVLESFAGRETMETCLERLSHVLWMASSTVRAQASSPAELAAAFDRSEREEPSGLRAVDPSPLVPKPSSASQSGPSIATSSARTAQDVPAVRRSPTLGRLSMTQVRAGTVLEVSATRAPARGPVLVLSLDSALIKDVERELAGKRTVLRIGSQAELVRGMTTSRAQGFSVVVDAALPSVELSVFASLSSLLPTGTRVVLWGIDARQKKRLCTVFPQANEWIASGEATSVADLLAELD